MQDWNYPELLTRLCLCNTQWQNQNRKTSLKMTFTNDNDKLAHQKNATVFFGNYTQNSASWSINTRNWKNKLLTFTNFRLISNLIHQRNCLGIANSVISPAEGIPKRMWKSGIICMCNCASDALLTPQRLLFTINEWKGFFVWMLPSISSRRSLKISLTRNERTRTSPVLTSH